MEKVWVIVIGSGEEGMFIYPEEIDAADAKSTTYASHEEAMKYLEEKYAVWRCLAKPGRIDGENPTTTTLLTIERTSREDSLNCLKF